MAIRDALENHPVTILLGILITAAVFFWSRSESFVVQPLQERLEVSKDKEARGLRSGFVNEVNRFSLEPPDPNLSLGANFLFAPEILARTETVYSGLKSYADDGVVSILSSRTEGALSTTRRLRFSTRFIRGGRFKFEAQSRFLSNDWTRFMVLRDGYRTLFGSDRVGGTLEVRDVTEAVSRIGGSVASRVPLYVPALLGVVEHGDLLLTKLKRPERATDEVLSLGNGRGTYCLRIRGEMKSGEVCTLWIDAATFLLQRVECGYPIHPKDRSRTKREELVEYIPQANIQLLDDDFGLVFR